MAEFNPETVLTRRAQQSRIWLAHDDRRSEWIAEVVVRQKEGIRYLVNRYSGDRPFLAEATTGCPSARNSVSTSLSARAGV